MILRGDSETRLLVVQPYIPTYRIPLFERMRSQLQLHNVKLAVAAAEAVGADLEREDDQTRHHADYILSEHRFEIGSRYVLFRDLGPAFHDYRPTLVIVEQAVKNLETWRLAMRTPRRSFGLAMWGHGADFSTVPTPVSAALRQWLTRRMDWFFAYTEEGAAVTAQKGFASSRVTTLNNSTDTRQLRTDLSKLDPNAIQEFRDTHQLIAGKTALFLGGIDERKGIGFLLDAAQLIGQQLPGFKLVVAGAGRSAGAVREEQQRGSPIIYLGRLDGYKKALVLAAADVLMIPEWVGLVAVDALAAGRPLISTKHLSHSPEFGYLQPGNTALIADHNVVAYASTVVDILNDSCRLHAMQRSAYEAGSHLSIEAMSDRFTEGILKWRRMKS